MTIEKLTDDERARLERLYQTPLRRKALRIIDALTAENEWLRAESEARRTTLFTKADELAAEWRRAEAAEARLATAVGLLNSTVPHLPFDVAEPVYAFLASAQPAAPACATCKGEGKVIGDCGDSPNMWFDPCPDCQPAAPEGNKS
jgi:hypothetical protein